ncbi:MAG: protease complex subunit PrcB family protein [Firmicutes bacterium]|nr:protease complex subunit PrcB family protein [Bacillota bacterium]
MSAYRICLLHMFTTKTLEGAENMKKQWIAISVLGLVLIALIIGFGIYGGNGEVKFEDVQTKSMPRELEADIIPQYRDIERALACKISDEIYILAMRGEKPTSGYEIQITELQLKNENQKTKLVVYADFADPAKPENMAQVKSYPISVVKAELSGLPDTIELISRYPNE